MPRVYRARPARSGHRIAYRKVAAVITVSTALVTWRTVISLASVIRSKPEQQVRAAGMLSNSDPPAAAPGPARTAPPSPGRADPGCGWRSAPATGPGRGRRGPRPRCARPAPDRAGGWWPDGPGRPARIASPTRPYAPCEIQLTQARGPHGAVLAAIAASVASDSASPLGVGVEHVKARRRPPRPGLSSSRPISVAPARPAPRLASGNHQLPPSSWASRNSVVPQRHPAHGRHGAVGEPAAPMARARPGLEAERRRNFAPGATRTGHSRSGPGPARSAWLG